MSEEVKAGSAAAYGKAVSGKQPQSRMKVLGFAVAGVVLAGIVLLGSREKEPPIPATAEVAQPPTGVNTTPGEAGTSARYSGAIAQSNEQRAKEALESGASSFPTLDPTGKDSKGMEDMPEAKIDTPAGGNPPPHVTEQYVPPPNPEKTSPAVTAQMMALLKSWEPRRQTVFKDVSGGHEDTARQKEAPKAVLADVKAKEPEKDASILAGDVLYAVNDTDITTDNPGPVLATVTSGPYKGARILGEFKANAETLSLQFKSISIPGQKKSSSINAYAIDPNSMRVGMASDVDHHYLLRYGSAMAAAFVKGIGEAYARQGTTTTTGLLGTTTTHQGNLDSKGKLMVAIGQTGEKAAEVMKGVENTPTTITLKSGTPIGVLMMSDAVIDN